MTGAFREVLATEMNGEPWFLRPPDRKKESRASLAHFYSPPWPVFFQVQGLQQGGKGREEGGWGVGAKQLFLPITRASTESGSLRGAFTLPYVTHADFVTFQWKPKFTFLLLFFSLLPAGESLKLFGRETINAKWNKWLCYVHHCLSYLDLIHA